MQGYLGIAIQAQQQQTTPAQALLQHDPDRLCLRIHNARVAERGHQPRPGSGIEGVGPARVDARFVPDADDGPAHVLLDPVSAAELSAIGFAEPELSTELRVAGLPTLIFFRGGREVHRLEGVPGNAAALEALIGEHLGLEL